MTGLSYVKLSFRIVIALMLVLVTAVGYADSAATTSTTTPSEKLITLQVTNTPVIDALDLLFSQAGYKYTIDPGVSGNITLKLKGVKFVDALKSLADGANLTYSVSDGRYVISPKPKPTPVVAAKSPLPDTGLAPGVTPPEDLGPIFYGQLQPAPPGPSDIFEFPLGSGTLYALPNGNAFFVVPSYGIRSHSILNSPALNSNAWERFKREAAPLWFRPPKFE